MDTTTASDTIIEEITINSPADRIFAALTDPSQLVKWWGAEGRFQTTHMESDLRPGGKWMMSGKGMGGRPFQVAGVYHEVERPHLLVFTWLPTWDSNATETLVRIDLEEHDGMTRLRLTHSGLGVASRDQHRGWPQILGWLKAYSEALPR